MKIHFLLFHAFIAASSFAQLTDKNIHNQPSPPTLPASGGKITDPTFGTTIMRVTDNNDGSDNHHSYSYWPCHNSNNTLLYISSVNGQPTLYDFDPVNFTISNKRNAFQNAPGGLNAEDAIWSATNPDIMYAHTGSKLYAWNVTTQTAALIHDFSANYADIFLSQMSRSANDSVFAFTRKENVNYSTQGYVVWKKGNTNLFYEASTSSLDEVQVDKSGDFLVIKTGNSGAGVIEVKIANMINNTVEDLTDNGPDFSPGHSDNGLGIVVGADNWNNSIRIRNLATPHTHSELMNWGNDWSQSNHLSMNSENENWVLISFFSTSGNTNGLYHDEIQLISTDGNQNVYRLCHHQSVYNSDYWNSPRATISKDGQFVTFTSNWGGTGKRDVFVVKFPALTTSANKKINSELISVFPNPASDQLSITVLNPNEQKIKVINQMGQVLLETTLNGQGMQNKLLDIRSIPTGIYHLVMYSTENVSSSKFVKQ